MTNDDLNRKGNEEGLHTMRGLGVGCLLALAVAAIIIAAVVVFTGRSFAPPPPMRMEIPRVTADNWYGGTAHGGQLPWDFYPICFLPPCPTLEAR